MCFFILKRKEERQLALICLQKGWETGCGLEIKRQFRQRLEVGAKLDGKEGGESHSFSFQLAKQPTFLSSHQLGEKFPSSQRDPVQIIELRSVQTSGLEAFPSTSQEFLII